MPAHSPGVRSPHRPLLTRFRSRSNFKRPHLLTTRMLTGTAKKAPKNERAGSTNEILLCIFFFLFIKDNYACSISIYQRLIRYACSLTIKRFSSQCACPSFPTRLHLAFCACFCQHPAPSGSSTHVSCPQFDFTDLYTHAPALNLRSQSRA